MSGRALSVNISGPALSLLIYENINSSYEQVSTQNWILLVRLQQLGNNELYLFSRMVFY